MRDIHKPLRDELELQIASYGGEKRAPADLVLEFRAQKEAVERIDARIVAITVPQAVQDATGPDASVDVLRSQVKSLAEQLYTALREFSKTQLDVREETQLWRADQDRKRLRGTWERRAIETLLAVGVIVAIYLATH